MITNINFIVLKSSCCIFEFVCIVCVCTILHRYNSMHKDSFAKVETEDESVVWSELILCYFETTLIRCKYLSLAAVYSVLNDCLVVIPTASILKVLDQV